MEDLAKKICQAFGSEDKLLDMIKHQTKLIG